MGASGSSEIILVTVRDQDNTGQKGYVRSSRRYLKFLHVINTACTFCYNFVIVFHSLKFSGTLNNLNTQKMSEEIARTLKFLRATAAWKSNAQYLLEIELHESGDFGICEFLYFQFIVEVSIVECLMYCVMSPPNLKLE